MSPTMNSGGGERYKQKVADTEARQARQLHGSLGSRTRARLISARHISNRSTQIWESLKDRA